MTVHRGGLRILVVEDEFLLRTLVEGFLLDLGHRIAGSAGSAEAGRTRPDIVLMDIELSGAEDGSMQRARSGTSSGSHLCS
jgi:CheY-like chemotaxis protein